MAHAFVTVHGRLAADPETAFGADGTQRVKFRIGVTQGWGERKTTGWYGVVMFGKRSEFVANYCKKGDEVMVSGEQEIREAEVKGVQRTFVDITASSVEKIGGQRNDEHRAPEPQRGRGRSNAQSGPPNADTDLPFRARFDGPRDTDRPSVRARWSKASRA